jgi:hypothetical protein
MFQHLRLEYPHLRAVLAKMGIYGPELAFY